MMLSRSLRKSLPTSNPRLLLLPLFSPSSTLLLRTFSSSIPTSTPEKDPSRHQGIQKVSPPFKDHLKQESEASARLFGQDSKGKHQSKVQPGPNPDMTARENQKAAMRSEVADEQQTTGKDLDMRSTYGLGKDAKGQDVEAFGLEMLERVEKQLQGKGDEVVERGREVKGRGMKRAGEVRERIMERGGEMAEEAGSQAKEVGRKGRQLKDETLAKGGEMKEQLKEKGEEAKEKAYELKDQAMEGAGEMKEKAYELKDRAMDQGGDLKEKAIELKDAAMEKAGEVKEKVVGKAGEVKEKVVGMKDQAMDQAGGMKEKVAEKGGSITEKVMEKAAEMRDMVMEKAGEIKESIMGKAEEEAATKGGGPVNEAARKMERKVASGSSPSSSEPPFSSPLSPGEASREELPSYQAFQEEQAKKVKAGSKPGIFGMEHPLKDTVQDLTETVKESLTQINHEYGPDAGLHKRDDPQK